jgi:CCR4-NOT complex subunit CAF16
LREESEQKGATIFYATHIFDHLADWATDVLFFSKAEVAKCCKMAELTEYHDLVAKGTRVPLYTLMKGWVFREYDSPMSAFPADQTTIVPMIDKATLETNQLTYSYAGGKPQLKNVTFSFNRGARILVVGANGAGKSTLLSILGGKRMIPRGFASVMGKDCFNDPAAMSSIMYCGDWWRCSFFMNLKIRDLLGQSTQSARVQYLAEILQVNLDWNINDLSDGQRRRCQLLEVLSTPRPVYLMDEITSDLDIFAREGILNFLRQESEVRGATIFYCTHIFDHLEGWASHFLHMSQGEVLRCCSIDQVEEYSKLINDGDMTPLYSMVRRWIYAEYGASDAKPWRKNETSNDGRVPNLGLAGPFQTICG